MPERCVPLHKDMFLEVQNEHIDRHRCLLGHIAHGVRLGDKIHMCLEEHRFHVQTNPLERRPMLKVTLKNVHLAGCGGSLWAACTIPTLRVSAWKTAMGAKAKSHP